MPRLQAFDASARCEDCDWEVFSKNAHGIGVQHHRRTGHTVHVEQIQVFTYTNGDSDFYLDWEKGKKQGA